MSPTKQSSHRKLRNATPRQHDIEFAADIGQGLLEEVRKLQALVAQRDLKINELGATITRSDRQIELFDRRVKQMHEDQGTTSPQQPLAPNYINPSSPSATTVFSCLY